MSLENIEISVTNHADPSVTVAEVETTQGLDNVSQEVEQEVAEVQSEQAEEQVDDAANKTKDERRQEGKRIEKKIDKLYKEREEAKTRAQLAEAKLAELQKFIEDQKENKSKVDLDEMTLDERIEYLAEQKLNNERIKNTEAQYKQQIQDAAQIEWEIKNQKALEVHSDYFEVIEQNAQVLQALPELVQEAIAFDENSSLICYELCKNPTQYKALLSSNPVVAAQALFELKSTIKQPIAQQSTQSIAPIPKVASTPTPANTSMHPVKSFWELPMEEIMAREKQNKSRRF